MISILFFKSFFFFLFFKSFFFLFQITIHSSFFFKSQILLFSFSTHSFFFLFQITTHCFFFLFQIIFFSFSKFSNSCQTALPSALASRFSTILRSTSRPTSARRSCRAAPARRLTRTWLWTTRATRSSTRRATCAKWRTTLPRSRRSRASRRSSGASTITA